MNVNQVVLVGRLTRDPEVKELENDNAVAKFGLAVTRTFGSGKNKREEATFVDCTAWGNTAKIIERFVHKGDLLGVTGRLQLDKWEDKKSGETRSQLRVVAESVSLGPKRAGAEEPAEEEEAGNNFNFGANKGKATGKATTKVKSKPAQQEEDDSTEETEEETVPSRPPVKRPF